MKIIFSNSFFYLAVSEYERNNNIQLTIRDISQITTVSKSVIGELMALNNVNLSLENALKISYWLKIPVEKFILTEFENKYKNLMSYNSDIIINKKHENSNNNKK